VSFVAKGLQALLGFLQLSPYILKDRQVRMWHAQLRVTSLIRLNTFFPLGVSAKKHTRLPTSSSSSSGRESADKGKLPFIEEDTYSTAQATKIPE
jgi:hypothetical protein